MRTAPASSAWRAPRCSSSCSGSCLPTLRSGCCSRRSAPQGFCIYGPQALIGIAAANQATKKAAATANGLTGLFGYASTLVSGVGLGFVAQHYGWNWAYVGILGMAVVGMLVFLLMWGAKADGYEPEAE